MTAVKLAPPRSWSTVQAANAAGVTVRTLNYWNRTGLVAASMRPGVGTGQPRRYSNHDIAAVCVVRVLADHFGLRRIRTAGDMYRLVDELDNLDGPAALIVPAAGAAFWWQPVTGRIPDSTGGMYTVIPSVLFRQALQVAGV